MMTDKQLLETIYDILAQNTVAPDKLQEVLERIDHIDYDDMTISFDHDGSNAALEFKLNR